MKVKTATVASVFNFFDVEVSQQYPWLVFETKKTLLFLNLKSTNFEKCISEEKLIEIIVVL